MTTKLATAKPATLAEAKKLTEDLRQDYAAVKTAWFDMGKKAEVALKRQVPRALGINMEDWISQWADDEGGRTTIYDSLKIIRALAKLPESTVRNLPKGNALELTKLPESKRLDDDWVKRARKQATRDFKEAVRVERCGKREQESEIYREEWTTVAMRLPKSIADRFQAGIAKVARILTLDIERDPTKKIQCWEAVAVLLDDTDELHLKAEIVGLSEEEEGLQP